MITAVREVVASRDLFVTLVERQLRLRLKRSWLGIVWPTVVPFLLALPFFYVFRRVLDVPIPYYADYLLCGLIPWSFFQQALIRGMSALSTEPEIIAKGGFPYALLPLAAVAAHALNLVVSLVLFVGYLAVAGRLDLAVLPAVLLPIAAVVLFTMAAGVMLALADVYNHDVRHAVPHVLTIWFFVIPVVYRPRMAPDVVRRILIPEPMHLVVGHFRAVLYSGSLPPLGEVAIALAVSGASFLGALSLFRRLAVHLPEDI